MLQLGVIGTNWITQQFIEAAQQTHTFQLREVYSRTQEHAQNLINQVNGTDTLITTDLTKFFASPEFEVVYIASPNSLHFQYICQAIAANKQVIVEKPMVSTRAEFLQIQELLQNHPGIYVLEAARHIHEPEFATLKQQVQQLDRIDGATITYRKYSSRYDLVLTGQEPNIFSPKFSGGALYDLGVYLLYDAVCLFGQPLSAQYLPQMIATGVDGQGTIVLHYDHFDVTMLVGKISNSILPSEIYSGKKTLSFDDGGTVRKIWNNYNDWQFTGADHNPMLAETEVFAQIIQQKDQTQFNQLWQMADQVNQLLTQIRLAAGIKFAADRSEA
ncbi:gfo/Idh/MocA family oxidoreductase [Bombilactobacillus bombi]|uniref:Gfo/Idh/MocA family protein n=1 Tax=Bombilactobacillus bombi TaxID=1303590 RepID=UPI000E597DF8|nr:Gfo/Idh/MocA family oxidoreductase [Bombilactobacillus bombi]AXX64895.1 gfo/Idh/MocA family oxidoreductase [Bombilactobacillus bombi]